MLEIDVVLCKSEPKPNIKTMEFFVRWFFYFIVFKFGDERIITFSRAMHLSFLILIPHIYNTLHAQCTMMLAFESMVIIRLSHVMIEIYRLMQPLGTIVCHIRYVVLKVKHTQSFLGVCLSLECT